MCIPVIGILGEREREREEKPGKGCVTGAQRMNFKEKPN